MRKTLTVRRRRSPNVRPARKATPAARIRKAPFRRLRIRGTVIGVLFAVLIGFLHFQVSRAIPIIHDADGYRRVAIEIWSRGLFSKFELSDIRTWAYPTFLGGVLKLAAKTGGSERWLLFAIQLTIHIAAAFSLRAAMHRTLTKSWVTEAVFYTLLLHPFVLIYPSYMLTESLSLSLMMFTLAVVISLLSTSRQALVAGTGGLVCGLMIAIRPGSIFMLPILILGIASVWYLRRPATKRMIAIVSAALLGLLAPLFPQTRNNVVHYGKMTPLIVRPLSQSLQYAGIVWIKYATSIEPGREEQIKYINPFAVDEPLAAESPTKWFRTYPARGAVTIALHLFNLLDQDLPLTYNPQITPSYYPYVAIANLMAVALGMIGIGIVIATWSRRATLERWSTAFALVLLGCHLGMHSLFSVESRYGLPALIVLYAFATICCGWLVRSAKNRQRLIAGAFILVFCASGACLSWWVRWQAPPIRAALLERGQ